MYRPKSDIPPDVIERVISEYRREGAFTWYRTTECIRGDKAVGQRCYTDTGVLVSETPLKDGRKHGREYRWDDDGTLVSMEPFVQGKPHGTAKQYGQDGRVIGTYKLIHGTGYDLWRSFREDDSVYISEIHSMRDGAPHGYEWWLNDDQQSVHHERHWHEGKVHGIERMWNSQGRLNRGYPRYWINGRQVAKRVYVKAARSDHTLPPFRERDNSPRRRFPADIEHQFQHHPARRSRR